MYRLLKATATHRADGQQAVSMFGGIDLNAGLVIELMRRYYPADAYDIAVRDVTAPLDQE